MVGGDKLFRVNDSIVANACSEGLGICNSGEVFKIVLINSGKDPLIGIKSDKLRLDWHDLDGHVQNGFGLWINEDTLLTCFTLYHRLYEIFEDVYFKSHNLKGRKCKILSDVLSDNCMVELEENVGGGSGDGLGKNGHCVLIQKGALMPRGVSEEFISPSKDDASPKSLEIIKPIGKEPKFSDVEMTKAGDEAPLMGKSRLKFKSVKEKIPFSNSNNYWTSRPYEIVESIGSSTSTAPVYAKSLDIVGTDGYVQFNIDTGYVTDSNVKVTKDGF